MSSPPREYGLPPDLREALDRYRGAEEDGERQAALLELALSEEAGALDFLLDELRRPDPSQRQLVLRAVIEFGSREAVPALQELAKETTSPEERTRLLEAADYLALPTLAEVRRGAPLHADAHAP